MSKEVVVYQDGPGAKITRRVSVEELESLDDSWCIKASPSEIVELQKEADISPNEEMASKAAEAFEKRGRSNGSKVMEELAEDIREENNITESESSDPLTWRDNESHKEYTKRVRNALRNQESRAKTEELSQAPESESTEERLERLRAARDAFKNRGKIGESANEWGEIAKDIEKEIEALESGSSTTSELSSSEGEGNVRTIDNGQTSIWERENLAEIQSQNENTIQVLRDFAKESDYLTVDNGASGDGFLLCTTTNLHAVRSEVAGL